MSLYCKSQITFFTFLVRGILFSWCTAGNCNYMHTTVYNICNADAFCHVRSTITKVFTGNISTREVEESSPQLEKRLNRFHLYLGKCTRHLLFVECLFVACCVYHHWLFSLTTRCSLGTVIGMKPEVHCTSVASVVSLHKY